jgi:hypothetical protein
MVDRVRGITVGRQRKPDGIGSNGISKEREKKQDRQRSTSKSETNK